MPDRPAVPGFDVVLRGYDRRQVDGHVRQLGRDLDEARARASAAERRLQQRSGSDLSEFGTHVAGVLQRATEEADRMRAAAEAAARQVRADADRDAGDLRALAQQEADEARSGAASLLAGARAGADELLRRAQQHADVRAQELLAEVEAERSALQAELHRLTAACDQAREQARETAHRLLEAAVDTRPAPAAAAAGAEVVDLRATEVTA